MALIQSYVSLIFLRLPVILRLIRLFVSSSAVGFWKVLLLNFILGVLLQPKVYAILLFLSVDMPFA